MYFDNERVFPGGELFGIRASRVIEWPLTAL